MPLTGYLKIPDIPGESQRADHEGEIDIHSIDWGTAGGARASTGSGRTRARAEVGPIALGKRYDASSPFLALAAMQGKAFDEVVISFRKDSGEAHLDYLTITLSNVIVSSYDIVGPTEIADIEDEVQLAFEEINIKYTTQADDHSSGDEHEVEFNIATGA